MVDPESRSEEVFSGCSGFKTHLPVFYWNFYSFVEFNSLNVVKNESCKDLNLNLKNLKSTKMDLFIVTLQLVKGLLSFLEVVLFSALLPLEVVIGEQLALLLNN